MLLLCLTVLFPIFLFPSSVCGGDVVYVEFFGRVCDGVSFTGIGNASIFVFVDASPIAYTVTDGDGYYSLNFSVASADLPNIGLCAWYDNDSTIGFDYIPSVRWPIVKGGGSFRVDFNLYPAATINCSGIFFHLNFSVVPSLRFVVVDFSGERFNFDGAVNVYGHVVHPKLPEWWLRRFTFYEVSFDRRLEFILRAIGVYENTIIVPANFPFNVYIEATFLEEVRGWYRVNYAMTLMFDEPVVLSQGGFLSVSLPVLSLRRSFEYLYDLYSSVELDVEKAEVEGFYATSLRRRLSRVEGLFYDANLTFNRNDFAVCYGYLREAQIILLSIKSYLRWVRGEAYKSIYFLMVFIALSSLALAFLLTEKSKFKVLFSYLIAFLLYILLLYGYPCFLFFNPVFTFIGVVGFVSLFLFIVYFLSLSERFSSSIFEFASLAKRNLRRRKFRSFIYLLSLTVFVASLLSLSSLSIEYDVSVNSGFSVFDVYGLSVERYVPSYYAGYDPLAYPYGLPVNLAVIDFLNSTGWVDYFTFRCESRPAAFPWGSINSSSGSLSLSGFIGFSSVDDPVARVLSGILVDGRLPMYEGEVAISARAADLLGVDVGELVLLHVTVSGFKFSFKFRISGIFDDELMEGLSELSGRPFLPFKFIVEVREDVGLPFYEVVPCSPSEVAVVSWGDVERLGLVITRVFAFMDCGEDELWLIARSVALRFNGYLATVFRGGVFDSFILTEVFRFSGFELYVILLLVAFNASITSVANLYERRREVVTVSSLGSPPSSLLMIFVLEFIILGLIGSILGYVAGFYFYRVMSFLFPIDVKPNVSFQWLLFLMIVGVFGSLSGPLFILRSALIVLPSRIWRVRADRVVGESKNVWVFNLPIKISPCEVEDFVSFMEVRLKTYVPPSSEELRFVSLELPGASGPRVYRLVFTFDDRGTGGGAIRNMGRGILEILVEDDSCRVVLNVKCIGPSPSRHARRVAGLVRMFAFEWRVK